MFLCKLGIFVEMFLCKVGNLCRNVSVQSRHSTYINLKINNYSQFCNSIFDRVLIGRVPRTVLPDPSMLLICVSRGGGGEQGVQTPWEITSSIGFLRNKTPPPLWNLEQKSKSIGPLRKIS